jgi:hypothetical protein
MGVSLRKAAAELGISHVALLKATKTGRVQKLADGTYDVAACRRALAENSNVQKQKAARSQGSAAAQQLEPPQSRDDPTDGHRASGGSFLEAQRVREWLRVEKDKLDLARRKGELVQLSEINAYVAGMIMRARDILLRIGPELRDKLAEESDPARCEEMIVTEVHRSLRELAEYRPDAQ